MESLFSIIIPAHNEEKYILKTLQSIQQQTFSAYEVIVVANGCSDNTELVVQQLKDPRIKVISLPQANVSRARNYGAGKAMGTILLFLDADTQLMPDSLQKMKEQFTSEYAAATTKVFPDQEEWKFKLPMLFKSFYLSTGAYKGCSGALLCHREHFDAVNGYDSQLTVKEHRQLIDKLQHHGKYRCVDTHVITSMRRLAQWGLWKYAGFWLKQGMKAADSLEESEYEKIR